VLCLHPRQPLDRGDRINMRALQQHLPSERPPVHLSQREGRYFHPHSDVYNARFIA
jgi:hypothetical protein